MAYVRTPFQISFKIIFFVVAVVLGSSIYYIATLDHSKKLSTQSHSYDSISREISQNAVTEISSFLNTPVSDSDFYNHLSNLDKDILPQLMSIRDSSITSKVDSISKSLKIYLLLSRTLAKINNPGDAFVKSEKILEFGINDLLDGILTVNTKYLKRNLDFITFLDTLEAIKDGIYKYKGFLIDFPNADFLVCSNNIKDTLVNLITRIADFQSGRFRAAASIQFALSQTDSSVIKWDVTNYTSKRIRAYLLHLGPDIIYDYDYDLERFISIKKNYEDCLKSFLVSLRAKLVDRKLR